ncbi:MAG TPA: ABC transporter ATP-binding protein [Acetobacteraceae bacterium]
MHIDASIARLKLAGLRSNLAGPFDLAVAPGECIAVSGPSGSGKSLLLRMIADLDPNEGDVSLDGRNRRDFSPPSWRRDVMYSAAEPGWWLDIAMQHFPGPTLTFARENMQRLGLAPGLLDSPVIRLSTGERQRIALLRVLALDPPVLLLDEPTAALDQDSTARVETLLRERLAGGTTVVMVSHNPEQAARLGHRRFFMRDRRLVAA